MHKRAVIVDGDYKHETTAIDQMDSILDTWQIYKNVL